MNSGLCVVLQSFHLAHGGGACSCNLSSLASCQRSNGIKALGGGGGG